MSKPEMRLSTWSPLSRMPPLIDHSSCNEVVGTSLSFQQRLFASLLCGLLHSVSPVRCQIFYMKLNLYAVLIFFFLRAHGMRSKTFIDRRYGLAVFFACAQTYHREMKTGQNRISGILQYGNLFGRCKNLQGCLPRVIYSGNFQLQIYEKIQMGLALRFS